MTFLLNEDQRLLQDAAQRYLAERHPLSRARAAASQTTEQRQAQWREIAEQGWPALLAPAGRQASAPGRDADRDMGSDGGPDAGFDLGLGLGLSEAWLVAEAAGRHLVSLPLVANMVVLPSLCEAAAAGASMSAGASAGYGQMVQWARAVIEGDTYFADAAVRPDGSVFIEGAGEGVPALAVRSTGVDTLRLERYAPVAGAAGLDPTMPVGHVARLTVLDRIDLQVDAGAWRRLRTRLTLLRSAELLGAASAALDMAAAYARERRQFDRAIGANQAIKHRLAQDWMDLDDARLAGMAAAAAHDAGAPSADRDTLYVPLLAMESGRRAAQHAIQTHGAMGVTWECDAHLYLKRVLRLAATLQAEASPADLLERIWQHANAKAA